uniref:Nodule-specific cysteine-rich peptide G46 n=2 Tax=Fabeae TaxID=163743 RepID=A0A7T8DV68_PEA|nr:nodule-specific cysteine-rich peptide G46 [Pisum sativum]QQO74723.1 nodule-specific cysteine-rich peptide L55 [Lens culinaris]
MTKTLEVFFHVVLFISLFFVVKEVDGMAEYIKCEIDHDCPKLFLVSVYKCIDNICRLVRVIPD